MDLADLTLDEPVDAIFANAVFDWIADHDALFARLYAVLNPGGLLVAQYGADGNLDAFASRSSTTVVGARAVRRAPDRLRHPASASPPRPRPRTPCAARASAPPQAWRERERGHPGRRRPASWPPRRCAATCSGWPGDLHDAVRCADVLERAGERARRSTSSALNIQADAPARHPPRSTRRPAERPRGVTIRGGCRVRPPMNDMRLAEGRAHAARPCAGSDDDRAGLPHRRTCAALPTPGGAADFAAAGRGSSPPATRRTTRPGGRACCSPIRWKLGALLALGRRRPRASARRVPTLRRPTRRPTCATRRPASSSTPRPRQLGLP